MNPHYLSSAYSFRTSDDLVKGILLAWLDAGQQGRIDYNISKAKYTISSPSKSIFSPECMYYVLRILHLLLGEAGLSDDAVGVVDDIYKYSNG